MIIFDCENLYQRWFFYRQCHCWWWYSSAINVEKNVPCYFSFFVSSEICYIFFYYPHLNLFSSCIFSLYCVALLVFFIDIIYYCEIFIFLTHISNSAWELMTHRYCSNYSIILYYNLLLTSNNLFTLFAKLMVEANNSHIRRY